MGKAGDEFEKEHHRQIMLEKRRLTSEEKEKSLALRQDLLLGKEFDDLHDPNRRVRYYLLSSVIQMKEFCQGHVIRRTLDSCKYDGSPINDQLPPFKTTVLSCHLSPMEWDNLVFNVEKLFEKRHDNPLKFQSEASEHCRN